MLQTSLNNLILTETDKILSPGSGKLIFICLIPLFKELNIFVLLFWKVSILKIKLAFPYIALWLSFFVLFAGLLNVHFATIVVSWVSEIELFGIADFVRKYVIFVPLLEQRNVWWLLFVDDEIRTLKVQIVEGCPFKVYLLGYKWKIL